MSEKKMIKAAIAGYGNLGKSLRRAIENSDDYALVGIFSRRSLNLPLYLPLGGAAAYANCIDVLFLAFESSSLPTLAPAVKYFDTVDSFDIHQKAEEYAQRLNEVKPNTLSLYGAGWDPGLLSIIRSAATLCGKPVTTWGKGVSQGHSNALRRINGVTDGVEVTLPVGLGKHKRLCYVCCDKALQERIEGEIRQIPCYFEGQDVEVRFCTKQQVERIKREGSHAGRVTASTPICSADFLLKTQSNTDLTAAIMLTYGKVLTKLKAEGKRGAFSVLDIPLRYLGNLL
ncbi:MAG TPA: hypothetical protein IAC72_01100 [Candidatus Fimimonas merdipullorum]|uniref:Meso-diaminopimelate D-dehydrogenase n=1 Tax=Candidatus Fimimonas merdipullorum TaxID=2840822 RepID=A0A9D1MW48_9BACT|nr:hypothetical protein [Candidatus Fimimonas merdipullorum]